MAAGHDRSVFGVMMDRYPAPRRLAAAATAAVAVLFGHASRTIAASQLGSIFVIDLENHNWTQPDGNVAGAPINGSVTGGTVSTGGIQQIYGNPAAPFINSLVTPGNPNAAEVSYSSSNHNVLATASGNNPSIHPSELNYIWQETGNNDGVANDADPYGSSGNVAVVQSYLSANPAVSGQHLTGMMQAAGLSWKSYDEDSNLLTTAGANADTASGTVTNTPVGPGSTTVPLSSFSGTSASYTNAYNGSHQYNFATKHIGSLFFTDTNGGGDTTTFNPEASHYAPLQQLQTDLNNNAASRYNLIIPDQYNDMHTSLSGGFVYHGIHYANDAAQIAQGDNFLSIVVPEIEASAAFKNNGAIIIWTDEVEPDATDDTGSYNNYTHTLSDIVISPLAKGNAYRSDLNYSHSSDLATMQEIFGLASTSAGLLNDAGSPDTNDLSDFFVGGTVPNPNTVFNFAGPGGSIAAPTSGGWATASNWVNGITPATSINKELDFLDTSSTGYVATDDLRGVFSLNNLVLGNNAANTDAIANGSNGSLSFAGITPAITQDGSGAFMITSPIAIAANPLSINGPGTGALSLKGAISGAGFGVALSALNVTTFYGANTYTGTTTINSGTLLLDYTLQNNSKVSATAALTIGSGTLQVNGNAGAAYTQTVAGLNLSGGAATVNIASGQTSLSLGAITWSTGGSVNFINNGIGTTIVTTTGVEGGNTGGSGIIGAYAVYNGMTWATVASNTSGNVIGFTAFGSTNGSTGSIDPNHLSLDITSSAPSFTGNVETIRYNTPTPITTTLGNTNLVFTGTYGGILMTANAGQNNNVIQNNLIKAGGGDFYIHQYDTLGTLAISSQFDQANSSPYNLVKDGPGTVNLNFNGTENYSGNLYLNGGLVSTAYPTDLQNTLIFNGGGLQPLNGITISNVAIINAGGATLDIPPGMSSLFTGSYSGVGGLTKADAGTATLSARNSYIGETTVTGGTLYLVVPGALPFDSALAISSGAKAVAAASGPGANINLFTSALNIAGTGTLDLNSNDLIVQNGSLATIFSLVAQGYSGGAWNGTGITSTAAANDTTHLTALGVIQNSADGTPSGTVLYAGFDGITNGANTDVLVKYTYYGDANLDGKVDGSDYSRIDSGYLNHTTGWYNGDFNYDGVINGSDYTLIDNAFNMQGASIAAVVNPQVSITTEIAGTAAVPEPGSLGILGVACLSLRRRRCRRCV